MDVNQVKNGLKVLTNEELGETTGMLVAPRFLEARVPSTEGVVRQIVPGHGGDVWCVEHPNGFVGAYSSTEFNPLTDAAMPDGRAQAEE